MEAVTRKTLVVLLERDFKNERFKNRNAVFDININNSSKFNLTIKSEPDLTRSVKDVLQEITPDDEVVEILLEDIAGFGSDDNDGNPLLYRSEQNDYGMKSLKQEDFSTDIADLELNECETNGYVKKEIDDDSQDLKLKQETCFENPRKTTVDPFEDDSDYMLEDNFENFDDNNIKKPFSEINEIQKSDSEINETSDDNSTDDPSYNTRVKTKKKLENSVKESMSKEELLLKETLFYTCKLCEFEVKTPQEKIAHRKFHNVRYLSFAPQFRCPECSKVYSHSRFFKIHWQKHAGKEIFSSILDQCPHCPYKSPSKHDLKRHLRGHKQKGKFQCEFCSYSHDHQKDLTKHLVLHQKFHSGIYSCKECSYSTLQSGSLLRHKKKMHTAEEDKVWKNCPHCPFKTTKDLQNHLRRHKRKNGIKCPQCTYTIVGIKKAREHLRLHYDKEEDVPETSDPKPDFSCPHCPYKARIISRLKRHLMVHDIGTKLFCADCPFSCKDKEDLIRHVVWHKKSGRYKCPWCSYSNDCVGMVTRHKRLHEDNREAQLKTSNKKHKERYRCPICKKVFKFPALVKRHMRKHQNLNECKEAVYCANCPYKSKDKGNSFIKHLQDHLRKDGLKCDYCSFRHELPRVIKIHMRLHKDSK